MILFNPKKYQREHADEKSRNIALKTIEFFESKGLKKIKQDDQAGEWYQDFIDFIKQEQVFATMLTPSGYGAPDSRWDMYRISEFNEILAFYGLCYWYAWQVSILGLGPIWMGSNEAVKHKAAQKLQEGGVFAFGLSEQKHGADIYSTGMTVFDNGDGTYMAEGNKYYIGNGNVAALVSVFAKMDETDEYVFFAVESDHPKYECVQKIDTSGVRQAFVSEFALHGYPITDEDILSRGQAAWDSALSTVNVGKYELGMASVGMATHCFYEALNHAGNRVLYGRHVTDFPHVKRIFAETYCRITAMKLFGMRAADYMRTASETDRRYLLFNPIVKMKVTGQGEKVISMLHEVIAARGYEQKETYFEMAIREIGMLPRLEGTEHVNMALIIKFIRNYLFNPQEFPEIPRRNEAGDDSYLFRQHTGGLSKVTFPDYHRCYDGWDLPNVQVFREQVELYRDMLMKTPPSNEQAQNMDYMLAGGELFTNIAYAQLILENARIYEIDEDIVDHIFNFLVRDFSASALQMIMNHSNSPEQEIYFQQMLKKPVRDKDRFDRLWNEFVFALKDQYYMNE
jgi:acyl-CoA dehydrogenase